MIIVKTIRGADIVKLDTEVNTYIKGLHGTIGTNNRGTIKVEHLAVTSSSDGALYTTYTVTHNNGV